MRALKLIETEKERRRLMYDLRRAIHKRNQACSFEEWLKFQEKVDEIFRDMGYPQAQYSHLVDQELIFPNVRRSFNGQGLSD